MSNARNLARLKPTNAGLIESSALTGDAVPIGVGQTWQDVKSSRISGVTYTNSTGKPIMVSVTTQDFRGSGFGSALLCYVNGSQIMYAVDNTVNAENGGAQVYSFIVPSGATYKCIAEEGNGYTDTFIFWWELR